MDSFVLLSSENEGRTRSTKLMGPPAILEWPHGEMRGEKKNQKFSNNGAIRENYYYSYL